jgi:nicotinamide-nucleotide amidase
MKSSLLEKNPVRTLGIDARGIRGILDALFIERQLCTVRLRETAEGVDVYVYDAGCGTAGHRRTLKEVAESLAPYVYGCGETDLAKGVGKLFLAKGRTLALAESLTGGLISDRLTDLPGSSGFFMLGAVVYSNESKTRLLGVPSSVIERWGAVSRATCLAMVEGLGQLGKFHDRVAVTGIAGPGGGTRSKPVGTVFAAVRDDASTLVKRYNFAGTRREIKESTVQAVLELLWKKLAGLQAGGNR